MSSRFLILSPEMGRWMRHSIKTFFNRRNMAPMVALYRNHSSLGSLSTSIASYNSSISPSRPRNGSRCYSSDATITVTASFHRSPGPRRRHMSSAPATDLSGNSSSSSSSSSSSGSSNNSSSSGSSSSSSSNNNPLAESSSTVKLALLGNMLITSAKAAAWMGTGSSAMLSETIHSLVDSGNQALLLVGLRGSKNSADVKYQYGYGKQIYFWSLISALGTFWFGAGVTFLHSVDQIIHPSLTVGSIGSYVWAVLGFSFAVDGYVFLKTLNKVIAAKPAGVPLTHYIQNMRDPTTAAVLMEDGAACSGVLIAAAGIGASHLTGSPLWDGAAGLGISALLGTMGLYLVRLNQRYLLGRSVDAEIIAGIKEILMSRASIEEVHSVQSQWNGPNSFSYKAEVAFDGTFLAASLLNRYETEFVKDTKLDKKEVKLLLAWFAEDVMRTVEQEVNEVEEEIRKKYPEATYIELEPDSKMTFSYAIDEGRSLKTHSDKEIAEIDKIQMFIRKRKVIGLPKQKLIEQYDA